MIKHRNKFYHENQETEHDHLLQGTPSRYHPQQPGQKTKGLDFLFFVLQMIKKKDYQVICEHQQTRNIYMIII